MTKYYFIEGPIQGGDGSKDDPFVYPDQATLAVIMAGIEAAHISTGQPPPTFVILQPDICPPQGGSPMSIVGTELEAVQEIQRRSGQYNLVSMLTTDLSTEIGKILALLRYESATLQGRGWRYNQLTVQFEVGTNNRITLPPSIIRLSSSGRSTYLQAEMRGNQLYDLNKQTFEWTGPVTCDATFLLDWGCIPFPFKRWITMQSAYRYLIEQPTSNDRANNGLLQGVQRDLLEAKASAETHDQESAKRSVPTTLNELYANGFIKRPPLN